MNLDFIASVGCIWVSLCAFFLHAISDPEKPNWQTYPPYVRFAFVVIGATMMWRGANFYVLGTLPGVQLAGLGHINFEGLLALFAIDYYFGVVVWLCAVERYLPAGNWAQLQAEQRAVKHKSWWVM